MYAQFDKPTLGDMRSFNRLTKLETKIDDQLKILYAETNKTTVSSIKQSYKTIYKGTGGAIQEALKTDIAFATVNTDEVIASVTNPLDKISWKTRNKNNILKMSADIRSEITQGLIQGKSYAKTAKAVTDKVNIGASKALRIVRTETHRAGSLARLKSFSDNEKMFTKNGYRNDVTWATAGSNIRESHKPMNGKIQDKDGYFTFSSGTKTTAPGNSGVASEDVNCRCVLISELTEI